MITTGEIIFIAALILTLGVTSRSVDKSIAARERRQKRALKTRIVLAEMELAKAAHNANQAHDFRVACDQFSKITEMFEI